MTEKFLPQVLEPEGDQVLAPLWQPSIRQRRNPVFTLLLTVLALLYFAWLLLSRLLPGRAGR